MALHPSRRVLAWQAAWESRDPEKVAALYADNATHASAVVSQIYPEIKSSVLKGRDQIREYARHGFARFTHLRFELLTVVESDSAAAVEYLRHSNIEPDKPKHVMELLEWDGELIRACRVFHT
jgi:nuclear transport factor 2 (NTF2) superfamily protein